MSQPQPPPRNFTPGDVQKTPPLDSSNRPTAPVGEMPTIITQPPKFHEPGGLVGQVFGDFEMLQELGRGGMGMVYKARQVSLDRSVAVKLLLGEHAGNQGLLQRFLTEARASASLAHPNIVSVFQVGECPAGPYFVMEFIDGPALEQLLDRTLPINWIVSLMITVADAVQHAHSKGIIHRDLKPGNIMIHQSRRPVVMDFGIAKVLNKGTGMTQPGAIIGTPAYMPPEQAGDEPNKIGPHSDVYSLGAILYTLLTGKVPFDEGTALRTILKVISDQPPPSIRAARPEVPAALEKIAMKCLEKNIARRYPSAQALGEDLKRFKSQKTTRASSLSIRAAMPTVLLTAPGGKQIRLFNPSTVIGRAQECDLTIKSSEVSKRHCRILITSDHAIVEDLDSVNGTSINGEPITRARLRDGDELDIAGHVFRVTVQGTEE